MSPSRKKKKPHNAPTCRRLVCTVCPLREFAPVLLACLIDDGDANLEIHGDVVSSGSDARDRYILV